MPSCLKIRNQVTLSASLESLLNSQSGSSVDLNTVILALRRTYRQRCKEERRKQTESSFWWSSSSVQGVVIQQIASSFDLGC